MTWGLAGGAKFLVIDDDRDVADSLAMLLESFDACVRVAYDGVSGVNEAAAFRPDIAFIDIRMPGIDGYETARRIRARLEDEAPVLVALTGLGRDKDGAPIKAADFDLLLIKPLTAEALADVMKRRPR